MYTRLEYVRVRVLRGHVIVREYLHVYSHGTEERAAAAAGTRVLACVPECGGLRERRLVTCQTTVVHIKWCCRTHSCCVCRFIIVADSCTGIAMLEYSSTYTVKCSSTLEYWIWSCFCAAHSRCLVCCLLSYYTYVLRVPVRTTGAVMYPLSSVSNGKQAKPKKQNTIN